MSKSSSASSFAVAMSAPSLDVIPSTTFPPRSDRKTFEGLSHFDPWFVLPLVVFLALFTLAVLAVVRGGVVL